MFESKEENMEIEVWVTKGLRPVRFKFVVAYVPAYAIDTIIVCVGPESEYHANIAETFRISEDCCLGGGHVGWVSMVSETEPYNGLEMCSFSTAFGGVPYEVQDAIREKLFALSNGRFANLTGYADPPKDLEKWGTVLSLLKKAE
jgi:hypothetical protein